MSNVENEGIIERIVYVNGEYVRESEAKVSIFDRGFLMADAVYEVTSVLPAIDGGGDVDDVILIDNDAHLARLFRSLAGIRIELNMTANDIEKIQRELVRRNNLKEGCIYLQCTRGTYSQRSFSLPKGTPTLVMFTFERQMTRSATAKTGLKVGIARDIRWKRCDLKTVQLLPSAMARQDALDKGLDDSWFVDDAGKVTEGTSNNVFIVTKTNTIISPSLITGMLHGITRHTIMKLIRDLNLMFEERQFTVEEAQSAQECMASSASLLVTPVVEVDGVCVNDGQPGPIAKLLRDEYFTNVYKR